MPGARPGGKAGLSAVDLEAPGQIGRQSEQLLVEPVAEAPHRLGQQQTGGQCVGERPEPDAGPLAAEEGSDRAPDEGAVDGDAALPDAEDRPDVGARSEVEPGMGEHVVDPRADDRQRNGDQRDVDDDPRLGATLGQAPVGQQHGGDDAGDDAQGVEVDRERAERGSCSTGGLGMLASTPFSALEGANVMRRV